MRSTALFASKAELRSTFIKQIPQTWFAQIDIAGFDIVLVRKEDGAQVGIHVRDVLEEADLYAVASNPDNESPDYRAILIPWGAAQGKMVLADALGVTVIEMRDREMYFQERTPVGGEYRNNNVKKFKPDLPVAGASYWGFRPEWHPLFPSKRLVLP